MRNVLAVLQYKGEQNAIKPHKQTVFRCVFRIRENHLIFFVKAISLWIKIRSSNLTLKSEERIRPCLPFEYVARVEHPESLRLNTWGGEVEHPRH